MEKISGKLASWKSRCLSMAGRATLIKAVAQAIRTYKMQFFGAPKKITDWMDRKFRNFFCGKDDTKPCHLFLKSWDAIFRLKCLEGMGIGNMHHQNTALIAKLGWQMVSNGNRTWVRLIRSKYLRGRRHLILEQTTPHGYGKVSTV